MMALRHNPEVIWDRVDGEMTLCDTRSGEFYRLNPTGAFIWEACDASQEEIVKRLSAAYPDQSRGVLERDVSAMIRSLEAEGLVTMEVRI
jgi:hypothetical protein